MSLWNADVVDIVCRVTIIPFVDFLHDMLRPRVHGELCLSPFMVDIESLCASSETCLTTSLKELSHKTFRVEDVVVREFRILNKFEPVCALYLRVGIWFVRDALDPDFLIGISMCRVVIRSRSGRRLWSAVSIWIRGYTAG